jgi:hypothetical protein
MNLFKRLFQRVLRTSQPTCSDVLEGFVCRDCIRKHRDGKAVDYAFKVFPSDKISCSKGTAQRVTVILHPNKTSGVEGTT